MNYMDYIVHYAPYPLETTLCTHSLGNVGLVGPGVSVPTPAAVEAFNASCFVKLKLWTASMIDGNPVVTDEKRIAEVTCVKCLAVIEVLK